MEITLAAIGCILKLSITPMTYWSGYRPFWPTDYSQARLYIRGLELYINAKIFFRLNCLGPKRKHCFSLNTHSMSALFLNLTWQVYRKSCSGWSLLRYFVFIIATSENPNSHRHVVGNGKRAVAACLQRSERLGPTDCTSAQNWVKEAFLRCPRTHPGPCTSPLGRFTRVRGLEFEKDWPIGPQLRNLCWPDSMTTYYCFE